MGRAPFFYIAFENGCMFQEVTCRVVRQAHTLKVAGSNPSPQPSIIFRTFFEVALANRGTLAFDTKWLSLNAAYVADRKPAGKS